MKANDMPMTPPAIITTQANGLYSLVKYQELTSSTRQTNGIAMTVHLNQTGRT